MAFLRFVALFALAKMPVGAALPTTTGAEVRAALLRPGDPPDWVSPVMGLHRYEWLAGSIGGECQSSLYFSPSHSVIIWYKGTPDGLGVVLWKIEIWRR